MLKIENISVYYETHRALKEVTFTVNSGEIVGVVGPNGAGKTTLFKTLARIIEKYEGNITLDGVPIGNLSSSEVGYLAEEPFQFDFFTPTEMLLFERAMRNINVSGDAAFDILDSLDLNDYLHKPIGKLSQGLKKRVGLATAFLGSPKIIILDEPLNSLDIQTVITLKKMIQGAQSRGAIVLISSHILDFFDGLTTRVVFLDKGSVHYTHSNDYRKSEELYEKLFLSD